MNYNILTLLADAPSFRSLILEITFVSIALALEFKAKKKPEIAEYLHSLRLLVVLFIPTAILVDVLREIHVQMYFSILAYVFVFVFWMGYNLIKNRKGNKLLGGVFIAITSFVIICFAILYSLSY